MASNWGVTQFDQLLTEPTRTGIYKQKEFHGRGVKIVNMGELFAHSRLGPIPMKRVELSVSEQERFNVLKGDLLFARRSLVAEGAGKCSVVLDVDEGTTFESSIIRARPDTAKVDPLYVYYFFNSRSGLHALDTIRRQVAVAGITGSDLAKLEIPVPSLPEQHAIASILGTLDDKIELNRRMNDTLEMIARSLFKSWFVDFDPVRAKAEGRDPLVPKLLADLFPDSFEDSELGKIPQGWGVATLADLATLNPESWSKVSRPATVRYVDLSNTKWGHIEYVTTYARDNAPSRAQRVLRLGDTIVGTVRPGNGAYALVADDGLTGSTGFAVLRPQRPEYLEFVYLAATTRQNIEALAQLADGGAYPAVRPEVVASSHVVRAPNAVLAAFSNAASPPLSRMAASERESRTLAALLDTLLPQLISGELRVRHLTYLIGSHKK